MEIWFLQVLRSGCESHAGVDIPTRLRANRLCSMLLASKPKAPPPITFVNSHLRSRQLDKTLIIKYIDNQGFLPIFI